MGGWDALPSRQARQGTATDGGFLDGDVSGCRQSF